ncbi:PAS domain S-box protein [Bradyrhizobium erythrophlei]|uniref:histidine kinase n=1 Tax=Bradyrhizobium erythrophlei TaxID=1437360 RepID=A0A1M7UK51_9BRAD|nr:PAS domain S-box protein [Bradyrhizobium erythrophlei]SHN83300.1 PAS domain S-box-containing protein [Bradyrhizobium erythrophlei]
MEAGDDRNIFLSTLPATSRDRTIALGVVIVSTIFFGVTLPFSRVQLPPVPAFVASYQSALAINDLITTVLLLSQFSLLRTRALLVLACGYLFTAVAAVVHALTFPNLLTPTGLFNAGQQTTAWLYMVWHGGFPLFVLGYAAYKGKGGGREIKGSVTEAIVWSIIAVFAAMALAVYAVTELHNLLPALLDAKGNSPALYSAAYRPALYGTALGVLLLNFAALVVLWLRRPHSVLDVWIMVVLYAWLLDIASSALLNAGRFDFGFYIGRVYGLFAACFVLAVLLLQNINLQARLSRLLYALRRESASEQRRHGEREKLFSAVVESSNDAIITQALDGTITGWNPAAERLFGYTAVEAIGEHVDLIAPPELLAELRDILARVGRGETIAHHETTRKTRDGKLVTVSLSISPLHSISGEIIGASKIARDITESQRTQAALTQEIEERQRIFETSQDLILVTDTKGTFVQVSPSSMAILGIRPDEMVGHSATEFIHPDDLDSTRQEMRSARRGHLMRNFETRYLHKDGHAVNLSWMGTWSEPVRRHFFVGRDLTEKQAAEAQLRQVQKMDAVGQLTGGVAHDFNNILTVITGTIGILSDAVANDPQMSAIARMIDDAAERGASLTKHLLAFARRQPLQPREIDVNTLVVDTIKLLRPTLGEQIQINPQLAQDSWPALVDPNQLTTAILNLSLNARDAMPSGGTLVVETSNVHLDDGYVAMNRDVSVGNYVMLAVSDTGSGISPENLERVFDPFFTTKEVGKGTGLGLSMVFGFVKQSNGHIKIYSEVGHGTTVKIYLPRATGLSDTPVESLASMSIEGGHETILVVEDDTLVRRYVITQIQSLGYKTLEASRASEALDIIDGPKHIDLLFTDVIMPGSMNGRQLVDTAIVRRPGLKTLFTSGYTENAIVHHGRLDTGVLLLAKPYRKSDLARMIRLALKS